MEPLGSFEPNLSPLPALVLGLLAAGASSALLELSRSLAEAFRGRWFAGNGRDLFHIAAGVVLAAGLFLCGFPPSLACLWAALSLMLPLLVLDALPARRLTRAVMLIAMVVAFAAPALLEPRAIVALMNLIAGRLF